MRVFLIACLISFCHWSAAGQTCGTFIGGYVPSWRDASTVDYSKLSHTFYAFAKTNNNGDLLVDNMAAFNTYKTAAAGTQRFLSLAGGGAHEIFSAMAASQSSIAAFTTHCVDFCKTHGLNGIDMDWEAITTVQDSIRFGNLVRSLSAALHEEDLSLVITLGYGGYGGDHYNVGALKNADWIQLMVYDQAGTWSESPYGNHASYQHMLDAIKYWTDRGYTDFSRMVIGVPFYGYTFSSTSGGLATAKSYAEIAANHPGLACTADEVGLTVFNGPETIRKKVRYVKEHNLKGIMIWEMAQDLNSDHEKSLLKAISLAACDEPASCSLVLGVDEHVGGLSVTPNLVERTLMLSLPDHSKVHLLQIMNASGRICFTKTKNFQETEDIDVSGESSGIYVVRIGYGGSKSVSTKFMKR